MPYCNTRIVVYTYTEVQEKHFTLLRYIMRFRQINWKCNVDEIVELCTPNKSLKMFDLGRVDNVLHTLFYLKKSLYETIVFVVCKKFG